MSINVTLFRHPLNNESQNAQISSGKSLHDILRMFVTEREAKFYLMYIDGRKVLNMDVIPGDGAFVVGRFVPEGYTTNKPGTLPSYDGATENTGIATGPASDIVQGPNRITGIFDTIKLAAASFMQGVGSLISSVVEVIETFTKPDTRTDVTLRRPGLSGGNNSPNPGGKVPMIFGTARITPYYAAAPYTSIDGTDGVNQYLNMLFVLGYKGLKVRDLKLGGDLLASNSANSTNGAITVDGAFSSSDVSIEVRQDGSIPTIYDASGWTTKETAVNAALGNMRNSVTNAGISGGELGSLTITINATAKTITRSAGNWGLAGVSIGDMIQLSGMSNSGNNQPMVITDVGATVLTCYGNTTMVNEGPTSSVSATVTPANIVETAKNVRKLSWTIEFPRGLVKFNKHTPENHTAIVKAYYRKKGDTDAQWVEAPAWTGVGSTSISKSRATTIRYVATTADLGASYTGAYETRVVFAQPNVNNTEDITYVEDCSWAFVRTQHSQAPVSPKIAGSVAVIALKVKASYKLRDTIEAFNCIVTRDYTRTGSTGNETTIRALADNPAAAFLHVLMDAINPRPVTASEIDMATILAWANSCTTLGLSCNGVVSGAMDMKTILQQIAATGRATFFVKDGLYSVAHDTTKSTTVAHIAPRNAWNFSFTKNFEELPHGFKITFTNKDEGYEQDERIVLGDGYVYDTRDDGVTRDAFGTAHTTSEEYLPGQNYVLATKFQALSLPFVTDKDQAWKTGRYAWEVMKYRNTTYSVEQDVEQLVATLGDKVRFSHPLISETLHTARIKSVITNVDGDVSGVNLDAPVTVATTYGCRIRTPSLSIYRAITNAAGVTINLTFSSVISAATAPSIGDLVFVGPAGSETIEGLVQGIQLNEDFSATLSIVPYAQEVFDADDDTPDDFYTKVIKTTKSVVATAIDSDDYAEKTNPQTEAFTNLANASAKEYGEAAQDYADGLASSLQTQIDRAIVYYTQAADPSSGWTTEEKKEHIGDYWRTSVDAAWSQWSGSAWTTIDDPAAQQLASDAQTTADSKITVWADLSTAQSNAEANDLFLASGLLYRCLTDLAATYERITPKRWPDGTTLPTAQTHEPLLKGDTFYETDAYQWWVYDTAWTEDGESQLIPSDITNLAPKYLGRVTYASLSGTSGNENDTVLSYSATLSECGIYKRVSSAWVRQDGSDGSHPVPTSEMIANAWPDITWAVNQSPSYPTKSPDWTASEKVQAYTTTDLNYIEMLGANLAFINKLFAQDIVLGATGYIKSNNYAESGGYATAGVKIDAATGVVNSYGGKFKNVDVSGAVTASSGAITGDLSLSGSFLGNNVYVGTSVIEIWSGSSRTSPAVNDTKLVIEKSTTFSRIGFYKCSSAGSWSVATSEITYLSSLGKVSIDNCHSITGISYIQQHRNYYSVVQCGSTSWVDLFTPVSATCIYEVVSSFAYYYDGTKYSTVLKIFIFNGAIRSYISIYDSGDRGYSSIGSVLRYSSGKWQVAQYSTGYTSTHTARWIGDTV